MLLATCTSVLQPVLQSAAERWASCRPHSCPIYLIYNAYTPTQVFSRPTKLQSSASANAGPCRSVSRHTSLYALQQDISCNTAGPRQQRCCVAPGFSFGVELPGVVSGRVALLKLVPSLFDVTAGDCRTLLDGHSRLLPRCSQQSPVKLNSVRVQLGPPLPVANCNGHNEVNSLGLRRRRWAETEKQQATHDSKAAPF